MRKDRETDPGYNVAIMRTLETIPRRIEAAIDM